LHIAIRVYCGDETTGVCIMQLQPAIDWSLDWGNVLNVILNDSD
jgi:hypothetical protein